MHITRSTFLSLVAQGLEEQIAIDSQTSVKTNTIHYKVSVWKQRMLFIGTLSYLPVRVYYKRPISKDLLSDSSHHVEPSSTSTLGSE